MGPPTPSPPTPSPPTPSPPTPSPPPPSPPTPGPQPTPAPGHFRFCNLDTCQGPAAADIYDGNCGGASNPPKCNPAVMNSLTTDSQRHCQFLASNVDSEN